MKAHLVARFIFEVEGQGKKNPARPITEKSKVLLFHNLRELAPCETFQVSPALSGSLRGSCGTLSKALLCK